MEKYAPTSTWVAYAQHRLHRKFTWCSCSSQTPLVFIMLTLPTFLLYAMKINPRRQPWVVYEQFKNDFRVTNTLAIVSPSSFVRDSPIWTREWTFQWMFLVGHIRGRQGDMPVVHPSYKYWQFCSNLFLQYTCWCYRTSNKLPLIAQLLLSTKSSESHPRSFSWFFPPQSFYLLGDNEPHVHHYRCILTFTKSRNYAKWRASKEAK